MPLEVTSFDMIAVQRPWRTKAEEGEARSDAVETAAERQARARERVGAAFAPREASERIGFVSGLLSG